MTILYLVSAERNDQAEQGQKLLAEAADLERRLSTNRKRKPSTQRAMEERLEFCLVNGPALAKAEPITYWKVGITDRKDKDPLKRDRKRYREVFRAEELGGGVTQVELEIARTFALLCWKNGVEQNAGRESLPTCFPLSVAETVFDFWLEVFEGCEWPNWDQPKGPTPVEELTQLDVCSALLQMDGGLKPTWDSLFSHHYDETAPWVGPTVRSVFWAKDFQCVRGRIETEEEQRRGEEMADHYCAKWFWFAGMWAPGIQNLLTLQPDKPVERVITAPPDMWS